MSAFSIKRTLELIALKSAFQRKRTLEVRRCYIYLEENEPKLLATID